MIPHYTHSSERIQLVDRSLAPSLTRENRNFQIQSHRPQKKAHKNLSIRHESIALRSLSLSPHHADEIPPSVLFQTPPASQPSIHSLFLSPPHTSAARRRSFVGGTRERARAPRIHVNNRIPAQRRRGSSMSAKLWRVYSQIYHRHKPTERASERERAIHTPTTCARVSPLFFAAARESRSRGRSALALSRARAEQLCSLSSHYTGIRIA